MINLHMQSRYSGDGEFTPAELVKQCRQQGITMMSITDHNCTRANMEARAVGVGVVDVLHRKFFRQSGGLALSPRTAVAEAPAENEKFQPQVV